MEELSNQNPRTQKNYKEEAQRRERTIIEQSKDQRTSRGYYHHLETCDQGQQ